MQVEVTLKKSIIGRSKKHRATVNSLGLRKINQTVQLNNTSEIQGMIQQVSYLLMVREISPKEQPVTKATGKETDKKKVDSEKSIETTEKKTETKKKADKDTAVLEDKKSSQEVTKEKKKATVEEESVKEQISEEKKIEKKEVVAEKKTANEKEVAA